MRPPRPCILLSIFLLAGCGSTDPISEETTEAESTPSYTSPPPSTQPVEFVTRTDTVNVVHTEEQSETDSSLAAGEERFAVQIGAFKEPKNASQFQNLTRERYPFPIMNEFNPRLGFYQIRIGSFASRMEARALLLRMQAEYPLDYKGSWIVHLMR